MRWRALAACPRFPMLAVPPRETNDSAMRRFNFPCAALLPRSTTLQVLFVILCCTCPPAFNSSAAPLLHFQQPLAATPSWPLSSSVLAFE
jgi:hypothetical protein